MADAKMCLVDFTDTKLQVGQQTSFILTLRDTSGDICVGENIVFIIY